VTVRVATAAPLCRAASGFPGGAGAHLGLGRPTCA